MKKFVVLLCAVLVGWFTVSAQNNDKQSLYLVHVDGGKTFRQKIYAYHFLNGSFTGRDEVIAVDGKREGKDYIRTDLGTSTIYNNRYLITGIGNIIDLKEAKVLFDGRAQLIRCSNDSAIFYTNDVFKGKFYSVYDFNKGQYEVVKNLLFKPKLGRDVEFDKTTAPFKIVYYPQGKPKVVLTENAGYGQQGTKDNTVPDPLMLWLDNDQFIYTHYNKENTELSILKLNVDTKLSSEIGKLAIGKELVPATWSRLNKDQLMMRLGNRQILIDLGANSVTQLEYSHPDNGFSYACKADAKGRALRLNGKDIGKFHFEARNFSAGTNTAAFVKELMIGTDSYQQGLMVWNQTKKAWEAVEADEVLCVLGWARD